MPETEEIQEVRLTVTEGGEFMRDDGSMVVDHQRYELPWGGTFETYEHSRQVDCGPRVYRTFIRLSNVTGEFEAMCFDPGTAYVISPEGVKQMELAE